MPKPKPGPKKPSAATSRQPKASARRSLGSAQTRAAEALAERRPVAEVAELARNRARLEGLRIERLDPLFARGVTIALERGAASTMLLTRRLGLPFARAQELLDRMIEVDAVGPGSTNGSHPLRITRAEWDALNS